MALTYYVIAIFILFYWYTLKTFRYWKNKNVAFAKPIPIFGNVLSGIFMRQSFGEIFHELYQETKEPIYGFYLLHKPALLIRDPEVIKKILISDSQYFCDRQLANNKRDDPISTHILLFLKNPHWKSIREKISPIYSTAKIKTMCPLIEKAALGMREYLSKVTHTHSVLDMKKVATKYTVDVITSTAFGVDAHSFVSEKNSFYVTANNLINWDDCFTSFRIRCYFMLHSLVKLFRMRLLNPKCVQFLDERFWAIMNQRMKTKIRRNDLIDILIELKNNDNEFLEGDVLTAQALVFFLAGFETSSSTIGFALYELAFHPEIQARLRKEIDEVSKKYGGINYESLQEMKYLDMVMKETLRKYPIVPVLERKCNTQYTIPDTSTVIDKNTPVFIPVMSLHVDPEYFPDPHTFNPERFAPENLDFQKSAYLPFGQGLRGCIGARFGKLTVKIGLSTILQNFVLEPCEATPKKVKFNPRGLVLSPLTGIQLKIKEIVQN